MSRRRPNADELALWRKVTETTQPLGPARKVTFPEKPKSKRTSQAPTREPIAPFELGQAARPDTATPAAPDTATPVQMDKKAFTRMKRGKLVPEAKLDLHGMTLDRAHDATVGFIMRAHTRGFRLVLIVTGKGKRGADRDLIPERQGVLRHHLPHWLSVPPLAQMVLQVSEAHGKHGGGGAYYVYLRRRR